MMSALKDIFRVLSLKGWLFNSVILLEQSGTLLANDQKQLAYLQQQHQLEQLAKGIGTSVLTAVGSATQV